MLNFFKISLFTAVLSLASFSKSNCSESVTISTETEEINFNFLKNKEENLWAFSFQSNIEDQMHLFLLNPIPSDQDIIKEILKKITHVRVITGIYESGSLEQEFEVETQSEIINLEVIESKNERGVKITTVYFTKVDTDEDEDEDLSNLPEDYKITVIKGKENYLALITPFQPNYFYDNQDEMKNNLFSEHGSLIDSLELKIKN